MKTKLFDIVPTSYKVAEFLSWKKNKKLKLSPDFQRRLVWNTNSKSYLIDTIIRWLPIPLLIIRERVISLDDYEPKREVVDWQQRLNTLFEFIVDESFEIKKSHNEEFWGLSFKELPEDIQQRILNYKFSLYELPSTTTDSEILEIFSRLNSTWFKLNKQELRNAEFSWEFKTSIYSTSNKFIDSFIDWWVFDLNWISRMKEAEFTTDVYIYMIEEKIRERKPNLFDKFYEKFDEQFDNSEVYEERYKITLNKIESILWEDLKQTVFKKESLFYHLFVIFYSYLFKKNISEWIRNTNIPQNWKSKILKLSEKIENDDIPLDVIKSFSYWTNNINSRLTKDKYLSKYLND